MKIIKKYLLYLLILFVFPFDGCTTVKVFKAGYKIKSGKDISIYVASDIHYLSENLNDHGEAFKKYINSGDGKQLEYIDEIMNSFVYETKNKKPNILIISGDLTNNGEKESHRDMADKLKDIEKSGTSVYVIPGNHDISNPWARGFKEDKQYAADTVSDKDFSKLYGDFGYDEAVLRDKNSLSYLAAPSKDVWLLMLDTNKYAENIKLGFPQTDGEINQVTLDWIKKCIDLSEKNGAKIIPVMHHNMVNHSYVINYGFTLNNNDDLLKIFKESNINFALTGHIHVQDISSVKNNNNIFYDIASNSLAVYPHQYGVIKYSAEDNSIDYSTSKTDVQGWAKDNKIKDENLINFNDYSEKYFGKSGYDKAYSELKKAKVYKEEEIKSMCDTMRILNLRYFAGREDLNSKDIMDSEGFKLWSDSPDSFLKTYILSMAKDNDISDNELHINLK